MSSLYSFPSTSSGSMFVLPPLTTQSISMYPATLNINYMTRVITFLGDQEQRWLVTGPLFGATLAYVHMSGYDMSRIALFFQTMQGMATSVDLTQTFSFTIGGQVYDYCVFDQDAFEPQVQVLGFSFQLQIRQLRPN